MPVACQTLEAMTTVRSPRLSPQTSPKLPPTLVALPQMDEVAAEGDARRKRPRTKKEQIEAATTLEALFQASLPDKARFHQEWLRALAAPSIDISTLEDVSRLHVEDIGNLPVPPLVRATLRSVLAAGEKKAAEEQAVLEATIARARSFMMPLRDRNMQPPMAGSKYFQDAKRYRLILTREEIEAGVRIVAHRIETWAKGDRIILVGILKGAFMFMADLCRALTRPYSVYFVEASSYKEGRTQGACQISADLPTSKFIDATSKAPHKIVLVDELLDNGKTMQDMKGHLLAQLKATHAENDILTCCLFSKQRERVWPSADITGIEDLPDLWLVGYGLDDRGTKRGWSELFAIPKVTMAETFERSEVEQLLAVLDDSAAITTPFVFGGYELSNNRSKRHHRVFALDAHGTHLRPSVQRPEAKVATKADLMRILAPLSTVKGKYEQELQFSFIPDGLHLVPEDEIFSGNNKVYARMRCRLRAQVALTAARFGLEGPGPITAE